MPYSVEKLDAEQRAFRAALEESKEWQRRLDRLGHGSTNLLLVVYFQILVFMTLVSRLQMPLAWLAPALLTLVASIFAFKVLAAPTLDSKISLQEQFAALMESPSQAKMRAITASIRDSEGQAEAIIRRAYRWQRGLTWFLEATSLALVAGAVAIILM